MTVLPVFAVGATSSITIKTHVFMRATNFYEAATKVALILNFCDKIGVNLE